MRIEKIYEKVYITQQQLEYNTYSSENNPWNEMIVSNKESI